MVAYLRRHPDFLVGLLILGVSVLVYGQVFDHDLLWWDDRKNICTSRSWTAIWTQPYFGFYIPVTYSLWSLLGGLAASIHGPECTAWAPTFHIFNLALHGLAAFLVFKLLRRIAAGGRDGMAAATLGALLFLVHPMQVETVAWISAGRDLLSVVFGLSGLLICFGNQKQWSLLFFALSMLAKPSGVIFPLLAIVISARQWRTLMPAIVFGFAVTFLTKHLQSDSLLRFEVEFWERPLIAAQAIGFYVGKLILPWPLMPDHGRSIVKLQAQPVLYLWALLAFIGVAFVLHQRRYWSRPSLWVLVAIAPVAGFVSFGFQETSTVAERFFYPAMIGIAWGVATKLNGRSVKIRRGAFVLITVWGALSFYQTSRWQDDESLFRHNLSVGVSSLAHANLANALFHKGQFNGAVEEYRNALSANPALLDAWLGLGRALESVGQPLAAQEVYRRAIARGDALPAVHNNLGKLYYDQADPRCEREWLIAIKKDPSYLEPHFNLGQLFIRIKDYPQALKFFEAAQRLAPGDPRVSERVEAIHKLGSGG